MKNTQTLKKNYEFANILTKGKYYSGKYIAIYYFKNSSNCNKIGIAVGTKIAKAVRRNRIRRVIRESYRLLENNIEFGYSMVFLWKKKINIEQATFQNVQTDMKNFFIKNKMYKEV